MPSQSHAAHQLPRQHLGVVRHLDALAPHVHMPRYADHYSAGIQLTLDQTAEVLIVVRGLHNKLRSVDNDPVLLT